MLKKKREKPAIDLEVAWAYSCTQDRCWSSSNPWDVHQPSMRLRVERENQSRWLGYCIERFARCNCYDWVPQRERGGPAGGGEGAANLTGQCGKDLQRGVGERHSLGTEAGNSCPR